MRAIITVNNAAHQKQHAAWMKAGLERHGFSVRFAQFNTPAAADIVVVWGWRQRRVIDDCKRCGVPILVMERGHLPPRMEWTSCGFNGLGNRGTYAKVDDGGARWREHFGHLEQFWTDRDGYALVCGQVEGDASLWGCDFHAWAQSTTDKLRAIGHEVVYRPHPMSLRRNDRWCPRGARFSTTTLAVDLAGAAKVITYNSTAGVETVLAGVPTVTCDAGAMAWSVTTHSVDSGIIRPDRTAWMHSLSWTGFTPAEIESGKAWDHLKEALPCATAA